MVGRYEEFPLIAEMLERAIKIRHRHRRAMEMNRPRAAFKAELDGLRLCHQIDTAKQLTDAHFDALRLLRAISQAQTQRSCTPKPAFRPVFRKSYALDAWMDRYLFPR